MEVHFFDTIAQQDAHRRRRGAFIRVGGTLYLGDNDVPAVGYAFGERKCMSFIRHQRQVSVYYTSDTPMGWSQDILDQADAAWLNNVGALSDLPTTFAIDRMTRSAVELFIERNGFTAFQRTRDTERLLHGPYARSDGAVCYVRVTRYGYSVSSTLTDEAGNALQPGAVVRPSRLSRASAPETGFRMQSTFTTRDAALAYLAQHGFYGTRDGLYRSGGLPGIAADLEEVEETTGRGPHKWVVRGALDIEATRRVADPVRARSKRDVAEAKAQAKRKREVVKAQERARAIEEEAARLPPTLPPRRRAINIT